MKIELKNVAKYAMIAGVALVAMSPELAHAASASQIGGGGGAAAAAELDDVVFNLQKNTASIPNAIAWFCYIIGVAFCAFGVFKLKQHADNAAQNKLGPALGVLVLGAAFLALPGLADTIMGTNKLSTAAVQFKDGQF